MITWLASNVAGLSIIGAVLAFIWPVIQFVVTRRRDLQFREFETYHRLIKELVSPDPQDKVLWIDRQTAIVFELRHFPRYFPLSARTLHGLRSKWTADPAFKYPRLIEEIDLTLEFLAKKLPNQSLQPTGASARD